MTTPIITLPWAVLIADNARHGLSGGRIILTAKYRTALSTASMLATLQWKRPALKESVRLVIHLHEPDKRRRDIGNYTKLIADCLTRIAFVDDSQIDDLRLMRGALDRANPRAQILVEPLSPSSRVPIWANTPCGSMPVPAITAMMRGIADIVTAKQFALPSGVSPDA